MFKLIADSGSTKTDWLIDDEEHGIIEASTNGINPVRDATETIRLILMDELLPRIPSTSMCDEIHFYGAGCMEPYTRNLVCVLQDIFPNAGVTADSDLLGAARALCGTKPGIVAILGTGSNSGYYDGKDIVDHVSPLGFILGDEGSGAVLGRTLVGMLMKDAMPTWLRDEFFRYHNFTLQDVIDKVYRQTRPNLFLASLVPFIGEHRDVPEVHAMLVDAFRLFLTRNIKHYKRAEMPVNFVGSIADIYKDELEAAFRAENMILGKILRRPIHEIAQYHKENG